MIDSLLHASKSDARLAALLDEARETAWESRMGRVEKIAFRWQNGPAVSRGGAGVVC